MDPPGVDVLEGGPNISRSIIISPRRRAVIIFIPRRRRPAVIISGSKACKLVQHVVGVGEGGPHIISRRRRAVMTPIPRRRRPAEAAFHRGRDNAIGSSARVVGAVSRTGDGSSPESPASPAGLLRAYTLASSSCLNGERLRLRLELLVWRGKRMRGRPARRPLRSFASGCCSMIYVSALTAAARRADNYFVYKPRPNDGEATSQNRRGPARARSTPPGRRLE